MIGDIPTLCSRHGARLRVHDDTDGGGGRIVLVDPCPECTRAVAPGRVLVRYTQARGLEHGVPEPNKRRPDPRCSHCLRDIPWDGKGRPPQICDRCKQALRAAREARLRERKQLRAARRVHVPAKPAEPVCVVCGQSLPYAGTGRPPRYCMPHHPNRAAYLARKQARLAKAGAHAAA